MLYPVGQLDYNSISFFEMQGFFEVSFENFIGALSSAGFLEKTPALPPTLQTCKSSSDMV
ncbi:MAG: hypothetical protein RR350_09430 [Oscillibacter sp.]